ncbi:MAG: GNAT family N-acetyltransferase [Ilumatobacteraceae bacterium]
MHLADQLELPEPYASRPYRGVDDHPAMVPILIAAREHAGDDERPTVEQLDVGYAHLTGCDPARDIAIVEADGEAVAYCRVSYSDTAAGRRDCMGFAPTSPPHLTRPLFDALGLGMERHMQQWIDGVERARLVAFAAHPGPGKPATGEAAWLEARGYEAVEWGASLVRPHLDDIAERPLPDGVEVRPVAPDQVRSILEAHWECFRGDWDFREALADDIDRAMADPLFDPTLWKIAWAKNEVVGQVKSYINHDENASRGVERGYTEEISVHPDWRNRGIAGALLAMSLRTLRSRGMTEAALGVDTNNPGGAFHLYTSLGFVLQRYDAVYAKPAI